MLKAHKKITAHMCGYFFVSAAIAIAAGFQAGIIKIELTGL